MCAELLSIAVSEKRCVAKNRHALTVKNRKKAPICGGRENREEGRWVTGRHCALCRGASSGTQRGAATGRPQHTKHEAGAHASEIDRV